MDIKDGFRRENYNCMASCPVGQDILDAIERGDVKLEDYDLSQWRLMHIGAQPVPPSLIRRWKSTSRIIFTIPTTA